VVNVGDMSAAFDWKLDDRARDAIRQLTERTQRRSAIADKARELIHSYVEHGFNDGPTSRHMAELAYLVQVAEHAGDW
jgi:hypothetical protein